MHRTLDITIAPERHIEFGEKGLRARSHQLLAVSVSHAQRSQPGIDASGPVVASLSSAAAAPRLPLEVCKETGNRMESSKTRERVNQRQPKRVNLNINKL